MTSLLDAPAAGLIGTQTPRLHSLPPDLASRFCGQEAVELAATAGLHLDPWQQLVLRDGLAERVDGTWAAFEVGLTVPRQCGKGSVLEALELAALFLADPNDPPPLVLHSAHEFRTSAEHFRRMRNLVDGSDHLRKRVRIVRTGVGSESIELHTGARLRFVSRTGGSGRGFSADLVVLDEAYSLTADSMAAILPTLSARPNPQVWYTSSAGMPASTQLARLRQRGTAGGSRLAYFEWSAPDDSDLDDPEAWAQANPALGIRIPLDFIHAEREAMPEEQFARERLGIWAAQHRGSGVYDLDAWAELVRKVPAPVRPAWSVEVKSDRSATLIAAAWPDGGRRHIEVVEDRTGVDWVVARLKELTGKYGGRTVTLDAGTAAWSLAEDLESAGFKIVKVGGTERAVACAGFYDATVAKALSHNGNPAVSTALGCARWKDVGEGARVFSRRRSAGDISALYAVVLALHGLAGATGVDAGYVSMANLSGRAAT